MQIVSNWGNLNEMSNLYSGENKMMKTKNKKKERKKRKKNKQTKTFQYVVG